MLTTLLLTTILMLPAPQPENEANCDLVNKLLPKIEERLQALSTHEGDAADKILDGAEIRLLEKIREGLESEFAAYCQ